MDKRNDGCQNAVIIRPENLPDTLPELAKFVLFTREKLVSVKAEIRALKKLELAPEIIERKRLEAQMVSEALLDAQKLVGTETKKIPKASGGNHGNQYTVGKNDTAVDFAKRKLTNSGVAKSQKINGSSATSFSKASGGDRRSQDFKNDTAVDFEKTKKTKREVIEELGFSPKQVERMEILADNPDVVEEVKAKARENGDIPTQTQVINMVKYRKQKANEVIRSTRVSDKFLDTLRAVLDLDTSSEMLDLLANNADSTAMGIYLTVLDSVQNKLDAIRCGLLSRKEIENGEK